MINGSPGAHLVGYEDMPGRTLLLGTDYQVLRPPFWRKTERTVKEEIETVIIMAGGTDHRNNVDTMVQAAKEALPDNTDIIVVGNKLEKTDPRIRSVGFLNAEELKEYFDNADLLLSAAGQTVAEAVSCTLPTIIIQIADNQLFNVNGWIKTGAVLSAGSIDDCNWTFLLTNFIETIKDNKIRTNLAENEHALQLNKSTIKLADIILKPLSL